MQTFCADFAAGERRSSIHDRITGLRACQTTAVTARLHQLRIRVRAPPGVSAHGRRRLTDGRIRYREDITDGFEKTPAAFDVCRAAISVRRWFASRPQRNIFDFERLNAAATAHRFDTSGAHWGNIACCCALAQAPLLFAARSTKPTRRRFPTSGL